MGRQEHQRAKVTLATGTRTFFASKHRTLRLVVVVINPSEVIYRALECSRSKSATAQDADRPRNYECKCHEGYHRGLDRWSGHVIMGAPGGRSPQTEGIQVHLERRCIQSFLTAILMVSILSYTSLVDSIQ